MRSLLAVFAALTIGCASLVAQTPEQRLYAAVADLKVVVAGAADYCSRPDASLERCRRLGDLWSQADALVQAVEIGVHNGTLGDNQVADVLRIVADLIEQMEATR